MGLAMDHEIDLKYNCFYLFYFLVQALVMQMNEHNNSTINKTYSLTTVRTTGEWVRKMHRELDNNQSTSIGRQLESMTINETKRKCER